MNKTQKTILKWLLVILIIVAIIYTFRDSAGPILAELQKTTPWVVAGICGMSLLYELIEGMITFLLARQYNKDFRYRWGAENALFCSFYRVATLGSGSGVAAIVYLNRHGVEYSQAFGLYMLQYVFHKISIAIFSAIFFLLSWESMFTNFREYLWLIVVGYLFTICIMVFLILFCCSEKFHRLIFLLIDLLNKKGKFDDARAELYHQCTELEEASRFLLKKKAVVAEILCLNLVKHCFWYGIPYLIFGGTGCLNLIETMAITSLSVMLAAVIPTPAGIGSTEYVFTTLLAESVGTGLAGSAALLYRFATFVFPFLGGTVIVIARRIRKKGGKE